jgi:hypothetical protein
MTLRGNKNFVSQDAGKGAYIPGGGGIEGNPAGEKAGPSGGIIKLAEGSNKSIIYTIRISNSLPIALAILFRNSSVGL